MPKVFSMSPFEGSNIPNNFDCLITAGGSDFRAYETIRKSQGKINFENILLFDFNERKNNINVEDHNSYHCYSEFDCNINPISCSIMEPSTCFKQLQIDFLKNEKIAIDISCFTKPYFFALLKYLKEKWDISDITIFYTEPLTYIFPPGQYLSYKSGFGPLSIIEMPGFPGKDLRKSRKTLIVLLGFDGDLSSFVYEEIAPDELIAINGFPAYSPKYKDISIISNEKLLNNSGIDVETQYVTANNPFETFNILENIVNDREDSFITIAPLGPKPMALGACLLAIAHPSVRIIYPLPERYANKTTTQCSTSWVYNIPLEIICKSGDSEGYL